LYHSLNKKSSLIILFLITACNERYPKKSPAEKAGESKSDKAKSVRKYTKKRSGCHNST
jgi:hypothetical protein